MLELSEAKPEDLIGILTLYTQLHNQPMPQIEIRTQELWMSLINEPRHHIIIGRTGGKIVTSCTITVILNLTHEQRPFALIENVVTDWDFRHRGYASLALSYARRLAEKENCYKIMLMTGSKEQSTLDFYRKAGFNSEDKTAFIQWL